MLVALGILIVNICQVRATQKAAEAAESAATTSLKQLDLSERPWISTEIVPGNLVLNERGASLEISVSLGNIGHSVAQWVTMWERLVVDTRTYKEDGDKFCDTIKKPFDSPLTQTILIFPGEHPQPLYRIPNAPKSDVDKAAASFSGMTPIYVITCVDYGSPLDTQHHQTRRYFSLSRIDKDGRSMGGFYPNTAYPQSQLSLIKIWDWAN